MDRKVYLKSPLPALAVLVVVNNIPAQVSSKGVLQFGLGLSLGAHATRFKNEISFLRISKKSAHRDGAITVTAPIEVQFQLGL